jgi:hypothetical protein
MGLKKAIKRYKRSLAKHFQQHYGRRQLNVNCDQQVIVFLKALASGLEVPIYVLAEHCLEMGLSEVRAEMQDEALKDRLCRHLVHRHLLVKVTQPQPEDISLRLDRLENAEELVMLLEEAATPDQQTLVLGRLFKEVATKLRSDREQKPQTSPPSRLNGEDKDEQIIDCT